MLLKQVVPSLSPWPSWRSLFLFLSFLLVSYSNFYAPSYCTTVTNRTLPRVLCPLTDMTFTVWWMPTSSGSYVTSVTCDSRNPRRIGNYLEASCFFLSCMCVLTAWEVDSVLKDDKMILQLNPDTFPAHFLLLWWSGGCGSSLSNSYHTHLSHPAQSLFSHLNGPHLERKWMCSGSTFSSEPTSL